jgi:hypothetical protein
MALALLPWRRGRNRQTAIAPNLADFGTQPPPCGPDYFAVPLSLLRARGASPLRLRLPVRAASSANICAILGPKRGLLPRIPVTGCRICCGNVNHFGQILPGKVGPRRRAVSKNRCKSLFSPAENKTSRVEPCSLIIISAAGQRAPVVRYRLRLAMLSLCRR